MNYYIQGSPARAEEIKAAFKKLCYDTGNLEFTSSLLYYTIEGKVELMCPKSLQNIIKTHPDYKELELPVESRFKVGDWIVRGEGFVYEPSIITEIRDYYICELLNGERVTYTLNDVHKNFHLWTIADAKDGDVLVCSEDSIFIYNGKCGQDTIGAYGGVLCYGFDIASTNDRWTVIYGVKPATQEQRDLLFAKMKEAGYEWDAENKTLKKIQPHYDISNFYAGMPVLVRDYDNTQWRYVQFSHCVGKDNPIMFNACGNTWEQCIPFEGNEHLLGTTDMCDEQYINW